MKSINKPWIFALILLLSISVMSGHSHPHSEAEKEASWKRCAQMVSMSHGDPGYLCDRQKMFGLKTQGIDNAF